MWSIQEVEGLYYLTIFGKRALDPVKKTEYGNISDIQRGRNAEELHVSIRVGYISALRQGISRIYMNFKYSTK